MHFANDDDELTLSRGTVLVVMGGEGAGEAQPQPMGDPPPPPGNDIKTGTTVRRANLPVPPVVHEGPYRDRDGSRNDGLAPVGKPGKA